VATWINQGLDWVVLHFRPFFQAVRVPIDNTLTWVEASLLAVPLLAMVTVLLGLLAWQFAGRGVAMGTVMSLLVVAMLGIWPEAMVTLSLVLTSLAFCLDWLPLGILLASSDRAQRLDAPCAGRHADHARLRVPGACGDAVWHWQRAGRDCDHRVCAAATGAPDQPGHSPGAPRPD
jgi:hypothetical protein